MIALSPARAGELIASGTGYTVDEAGCWIADSEYRAPNGAGPFLAFYESAFGTVPVGMNVVHLCRGALRGCVRPQHLDLVPEGTKVARRPDPAVSTSMPGFARRIRDEREARGMSQPDFAKELRVHLHTIQSWEYGERAPRLDTLQRLARYFGWDGRRRRWAVTFVSRRIVSAESSGAAVREVREELERFDPGLRNVAVYSVVEVGRRRRRRRSR